MNDQELRALAEGWRAMYDQASAALLRIRDELTSRDEMLAAARETLEALGLDHNDA